MNAAVVYGWDAIPPPMLCLSCLYSTAIAAFLAAVRSQWLRWSALGGACALSGSSRVSGLDFSATNAASWWLTTIREHRRLATPRTLVSLHLLERRDTELFSDTAVRRWSKMSSDGLLLSDDLTCSGSVGSELRNWKHTHKLCRSK